jgi:hypothetical protein
MAGLLLYKVVGSKEKEKPVPVDPVVDRTPADPQSVIKAPKELVPTAN